MTMYYPLTVDEYRQHFLDANQGHLLLDVRTPEEYTEARIPGTVLVPLDELHDRVAEVAAAAAEQPIVLVCRSGVRSIMGAEILRHGGITLDLYNLEGGTLAWARLRLPLDRGPVDAD